MINDRVKLLKVYLNSNIKHFLVRDIADLKLKKYISLNSDCDKSLLNGCYDGLEFVAPIWYKDLCSLKTPVLVINNIDGIEKAEQRKFMEILKYNKIGTFELPDNCIVMITYLNKSIHEDIFSLLVEI